MSLQSSVMSSELLAGSIILSQQVGLDSSKWILGISDDIMNDAYAKAVSDLAKITDPPNPFFDMPILSAATGRIGKSKKQFLFLAEQLGDNVSLKFFAPIQKEYRGFPPTPVLRIWSHEFGPIASPLYDAGEAEHIVRQLATCLQTAAGMEADILLFEGLQLGTPFSNALLANANLRENTALFHRHQRAALLPNGKKSFWKDCLSSKRRQRLRRAQERLEEAGDLQFDHHRAYTDVLIRFEEFLLLETKSWKGRRGTSMQRIKQTAAFARQSVSDMTLNGQCKVNTLRLNGKAIASMIIFEQNGWYFPWKIAYDEAYSRYSPGNILAAHVNNALLSSDGFKGINSLATSNNTNANHFWPDRLEQANILIGVGSNKSRKVRSAASRIEREFQARDFIRSKIKS